MPTLTIPQAREQLHALHARLHDQPEEGIVITEQGRPVMVVMDYDQYEAMRETLSLRRDKRLMKQIRKGAQEIREGQGVRWEDAKRRLGWA